MKITFLGGVGQVTGSRHLVEHKNRRILVDCGLFQGESSTTQQNWDPFPLPAATIDALILTHAHIDHTGYVPALVKQGFKGPIYCSSATYALCSLLLIDSASIQEEKARFAAEKKDDQAYEEQALYTVQDAQAALSLFVPVAYDTSIDLGASLQATLIRSGHILGSAFVIITDGQRIVTFSGDLGRPQQLILTPPGYLQETDFLVLESTYGDRIHDRIDPMVALGRVVNETIKKGGIVVIPSFAVERTQALLYCLYQLKLNKAIPNVPIFLDSPLAIQVTDLFYKFSEELIIEPSVYKAMLEGIIYTPTVEDSKKINTIKHTAIVIAGSGMVDGGRALHHIRHYIRNARNTILFVGFQAHGTKGRLLVQGDRSLMIYGKRYAVRAAIRTINAFSAHADSDEIIQWVSHFKRKPTKIFITHGEPAAAQALQHKLAKDLHLSAVVPAFGDSFELD